MVLLAVLLSACAQATPLTNPDGGGDGDDDDPKVDAAPGSPDATPTESNCVDKLDNDGDELVDCADPDCSAAASCQPETLCDNQTDDDDDELADCADPDCDGQNGCEYGVELSCDDDHDNDADGDVDCGDADCDGTGFCEYGAESSCDDDQDNDGDDLLDCADPDCADAPTCVPETDCDNDLDDDGDTTTDCADFDCDGVGWCEFGAETSCGDGFDNDGDGDPDCADPDCADLALCVVSCPVGSTAIDFAASGLPIAIPDSGQITRTIAAAGPGIVRAAAIKVTIDHTFVGDLVLTLQPPTGGPVLLSSRNGSSGDDYAGTLFTDAAATAITAGSAPFAGSYRPQEPLAASAGSPAAGDWSLTVADQASLDTGTLDGVVLYLCTCDGTPGCEFGAACLDDADNDGDTLVDCDDPDCAAVIQCIPEAACDDDLDNDLDGATDCDDPDCAVDCTAETDCHDEIDNDSDGLTDCQDLGCDSDPTCERAGEVTCGDAIDNDSDGLTDCADPSCSPTLICALTCSAGQVAMAVSATDLPRAISDLTTTTSTLAVTQTGTVAAVAVRFSATHTFDGDLDITLRSPAGTTRDLSSDNGSSGEDYTSTIFVDTATTAITSGTAPFTGSFIPEQPLGGLAGEPAAGSWQLQVYDDASSDTGSFTEFSLALCVTP